MQAVTILWFRQDLRLTDNPALAHATSFAEPVLPIYILDDHHAGEHALGGASRSWLQRSLTRLNANLAGQLQFFQGDAGSVLEKLRTEYEVARICWNRCYTPWQIARDKQIKQQLQTQQIEVDTFSASLLWEPWTIRKKDGTPYRVFTPFYRKGCLSLPPPRAPVCSEAPSHYAQASQHAVSLDALGLQPDIPWDESFYDEWQPGEAGAQQRLNEFLEAGVENYRVGRDHPATAYVSRLSPHLRFGEISPHQVLSATNALPADQNTDHFKSELAWREFSYHLLYQFPELPSQNLNTKFDHFPWQTRPEYLHAWQRGQTGYPIVDAGMRELWQTGYMHNRVRMITASFLVKNLLCHWRDGAAWFWDCLLDADLANNSASWQWVAGCGADAAPYFRIFNPVTQGEKFDAEGDYIRRYCPELAQLPNKYLFAPWQAPAEVLQHAGVRLGADYPQPIVDLRHSREAALAAYEHVKARASEMQS